MAVVSPLLIIGIGVGILIVPVNAQISSTPNIVSGTYTNKYAGVRIAFPEGWEGTEMFSANSVIASVFAGGLEAGSSEEIESVMMLMINDKARFEKPSTTHPIRVPEDAEVNCNIISTNSVEAAGITGTESIVECTADEEAFKAKTILIETETKWIVVSFIAPSEEYDENVIYYDNSLKTLQIGISIDPEDDVGAGFDLRTTIHTVVVTGAPVEIEVRSSSTVTAFELDEENKRISFQVDGETGVEGRTELFIGRVLEGPYAVAIDGVVISNYEVIQDQRSGEPILRLSYTHSIHDITVTGTNVVPEFSLSILGGLAAIIGLVILLSRRSELFNYVTNYLH